MSQGARAGEVLSRKVPYGYRRGPRGPAHLVVHEAEAAVVKRIFADLLGGTSIRRIAVALASKGTASPDGKPLWPLATIGRLLRNEAYVGRLYWNRTHTSYDPSVGRNRQSRRPREDWVQIPVPAIVSDETFEAVQQAAANNTVFSPGAPSRARSCSGASSAVATAGSSSPLTALSCSTSAVGNAPTS